MKVLIGNKLFENTVVKVYSAADRQKLSSLIKSYFSRNLLPSRKIERSDLSEINQIIDGFSHRFIQTVDRYSS